jgi:tetratricopeptide (TPR) repeat protein
MRRALVACTLPLVLVTLSPPLRAQESDADFFEKNVRPILVQRCAPCHTTKAKGGLRVDTLDALLAGGGSGTPIVPGDPEKSLLIGALRWTDTQLQMPPKRRLDPAQIEKIAEWIRRAGSKARPVAPAPAPAAPPPAPAPAPAMPMPMPATPAAPAATHPLAAGVDAKTLFATGLDAETPKTPQAPGGTGGMDAPHSDGMDAPHSDGMDSPHADGGMEAPHAAAGLEVAVAAYRSLIESFPNDTLVPRAYLHLGLCLVKLNKTEEARAALRRAHRLGKEDPEVASSSESALIALPPPPEPKAPVPGQAPAPAAPAPAAQAKPEAPRSPAQIEIDNLEAEKRDLIKKAQDLEDAGKIAEAYQVRAKVDQKVALIEKKRKEMSGAPTNKKKPQAPGH